MKKSLLLLIAVFMFSFYSCKKETIDVTQLLSTVPSSSAGVVVFNLEGMLEDAGCKIKDHVITPSPELLSLLEKSSQTEKENYLSFFNGDSGIEPKGLVVFYDASKVFVTFALYDVNKFITLVESKLDSKFTEEAGGVKVNGSVAVKGAQAWICLTRKNIDPDAVAAYASLSDSQSFLVNPNGEKLLTEEDDIRGWAMINTFANEFLGRSQSSMFSLGLGFLFEDAESIRFKVDFKKGEVESEAKILNGKGKPAKYLLPSEKVDVNTLKSLGGTCDAMMAFTLNEKLIKKFEQLGAAFGGSLFGNLGDTFKNVEGTVGVVNGNGDLESLRGVITTKGEVSQSLKDLVSNLLAPVSQEGKYLKFSKGEVSGKLEVAQVADELKGCCLGFVMDVTGLKSMGYDETASGFKLFILKMDPEDGGLEADIEVKTQDPNENALLTIIKNYCK